MSRTKENTPMTNHQRANGSKSSTNNVIDRSEEFFTDSLLDPDVTRSSRIPSPSPQKVIQVKQRRARKINRHVSNIPQAKHRPSASESNVLRSDGQSLRPAPSSHRRKSPSPLRKQTLATPPRSRDGPPLSSPQWHIRSPPPHELPDVYQQIADEEDLAATEGEFSEPDDILEDEEEAAIVLNPQIRSHQSINTRPTFSHSSRASTPTQQPDAPDGMAHDIEITRTASDPTGMSFVNGLTDPRLAATLTPHFSESAKDRARLREVWQNQKPIAFSKASKSRPGTIASNGSSIPAPRIVAFSKATRPRSGGLYNGDSHSDPVTRSGSQISDEGNENRPPRNDIWHDNDQPLKPLPTNPRLDRHLPFTRAHGFPMQRGALTEQNLEQQNKVVREESRVNSAPSSLNDPPSEAATHPLQTLGQRLNSGSDYSDRAQRIRKSLLGTGRTKEKEESRIEEPSQMNWEAIGTKDVPLESVEQAEKEKLPKPLTRSTLQDFSPEKSRRWDIDLTGHSVQVSESPPVRNKPLTHDHTLDKEIEILTKRAVATSRIGEIREKHSQERLRSTSNPSSRRSASISSENKPEILSTEKEAELTGDGEPIPNTPVVIFRSSSSNGTPKEKNQVETPASSQEYLQRIAKAMSNTPKSSPEADLSGKDNKPNPLSLTAPAPGQPKETDDPVTNEKVQDDNTKPDQPRNVAQTPKVVGAWTDTILPDTIKTVRQTEKQAKYAQTPHISAGGWIDTPAPLNSKNLPNEMTPIAEEIPEELMTGIVKDKASDEISNANSGKELDHLAVDPVLPKIGLAGILDRAKQKLASQDTDIAVRDNDTLYLGNDTIESLQDLLTLDAADLTTLSKLSFMDEGSLKYGNDLGAEAEMLEKLGVKLGRLCNNIHDARKGISKLEHQVSRPEKSLSPEPSSFVKSCQVCNSTSTTLIPHTHLHNGKHSGLIPSSTLTFSLPIPHLFHSRNPTDKSRLPRPTIFGWLTLGLWLWYLTECTMYEIYGHPTYADRYTWPSEPEPRYPFVLPTMLYRWTRMQHVKGLTSYVSGTIWRLLVAIWRIIGMWFGWTDGFVDSTGIPSGITKEVLQTVTAALAGGSDPVVGMTNDEFL